MGLFNSKTFQEMNETIPQTTSYEKRNKVLAWDPRSPSDDIVRTPIQVEQTPSALGSSDKYLFSFDPRSPSRGVQRTPVVAVEKTLHYYKDDCAIKEADLKSDFSFQGEKQKEEMANPQTREKCSARKPKKLFLSSNPLRNSSHSAKVPGHYNHMKECELLEQKHLNTISCEFPTEDKENCPEKH